MLQVLVAKISNNHEFAQNLETVTLSDEQLLDNDKQDEKLKKKEERTKNHWLVDVTLEGSGNHQVIECKRRFDDAISKLQNVNRVIQHIPHLWRGTRPKDEAKKRLFDIIEIP